MVEKENRKHYFGYVPMLFLSWLGLAGLVDNFVEWRNWFEFGVIQHWRLVQSWVIENLLFWLPFKLLSWQFNYLAIGLVYTRAILLVMYDMLRDGYLLFEDEIELRWSLKVIVVLILMALIFLIAGLVSGLFWPSMVIWSIYGKYSQSKKIKKDWNSRYAYPEATKIFFQAFLYFIPILFIATDILRTLS